MINPSKWRRLYGNIPGHLREPELELQIISHLRNKLTAQQNAALDHVQWFLDGGRATGRTRTAIVATIIFAMQHPGMEITCLDHCSPSMAYHKEMILDMLISLVKEIEPHLTDNFIVNHTKGTVRYSPPILP